MANGKQGKKRYSLFAIRYSPLPTYTRVMSNCAFWPLP